MNKPRSNEELSLIFLRCIVSIIIATHGWHRLYEGGYVPFGEWLSSLGLPFGVAIATTITLFEIIGSPLLALGKKLPYLCFGYIGIYLTGLFINHLQHGWFVVGPGRNGIEYSALIVVSLFCIAFPSIRNSLVKKTNQ